MYYACKYTYQQETFFSNLYHYHDLPYFFNINKGLKHTNISHSSNWPRGQTTSTSYFGVCLHFQSLCLIKLHIKFCLMAENGRGYHIHLVAFLNVIIRKIHVCTTWENDSSHACTSQPQARILCIFNEAEYSSRAPDFAHLLFLCSRKCKVIIFFILCFYT